MSALLHQSSSSHSPRAEVFQSTLWTRIRLARAEGAPDAREALEALFRVYWPPVFAFLRRCGHSREDAEDLTQGFFAYVIETDLLGKADPERGRFRSFLLGCLKFFVSNQQAKARAVKRGGSASVFSIDDAAHEAAEPRDALTPERLFERKWALAVLEEALRRLAAEYGRSGLHEEFAVLQPHLTGEAESRLPVAAQRLGKSEGAVRVLMFRLRNRFRRLVREVIAETVSDAAQVENELRYLEAALRDE